MDLLSDTQRIKIGIDKNLLVYFTYGISISRLLEENLYFLKRVISVVCQSFLI